MKSFKNDFPIFKNNPSLVYLDSAATSQKPKSVLSAIMEYYKSYNANIHRGLYPIAERATKKVEEVRGKVAKFINAASKEEIIFVRNATEAINLVANTFGSNIRKEDSITTTIMEHHSNFVPWQILSKRQGSIFNVIDINEKGELQWEDGEWEARNGKVFAITHVSNVLGTVNPIEEIIKELKVKNPDLKVLVDGAQAAPHMRVDVQKMDCDFYVFSGHKMLAGTGIGVLYGKKELLKEMSPFFYGGDMIREVKVQKTIFADLPQKFEAGTLDIAGIISLGAAIEYLNSTGMENVRKHEIRLTKYCLDQMKKIGEIEIIGPDIHSRQERSGVVSFNIKGVHAHDVAQILGDMDVCIRSGHHCAMPLHRRLGILATARVSFYLYNDEDDVDKFIRAVKRTIKIFQNQR